MFLLYTMRNLLLHSRIYKYVNNEFAQQQFQQPQMSFAPQFGQPMYGASVMRLLKTTFKEVRVTNPMTKGFGIIETS